MDKMSETFNSIVNTTYDNIHNNKIGSIFISILILVLILYVPFIRPSLPKSIEKLFNDPIFRLCAYSYIVYHATYDIKSALIISIIFFFIVYIINKQSVDVLAEHFNIINATTPSATVSSTPSATVSSTPSATTPSATTPSATVSSTPSATTPSATVSSTPNATTPSATVSSTPSATTPSATVSSTQQPKYSGVNLNRTAVCKEQDTDSTCQTNQNVKLNNTDFTNMDATNANLFGLEARQSNFSKVSFANANLEMSLLDGANLTSASFTNTSLPKSKLMNTNLDNTTFTKANCSGCDFTGASGKNTSFYGTNLTGAIFKNVKLNNPDFTSANLTDANIDDILKDIKFDKYPPTVSPKYETDIVNGIVKLKGATTVVNTSAPQPTIPFNINKINDNNSRIIITSDYIKDLNIPAITINFKDNTKILSSDIHYKNPNIIFNSDNNMLILNFTKPISSIEFNKDVSNINIPTNTNISILNGTVDSLPVTNANTSLFLNTSTDTIQSISI